MNSSSLSAATPPPGVPVNAWLATALRVSGLLLAIAPFLPPLLLLAKMPALAETLDRPWVSLCHRMPERSLHIGGQVMPICSRCLGLVEGLGLGLAVAWPALSLRALRVWLALAFSFLFLELTTQDLGWHPVFHPTRLLSGLLVAFPIGAAAGALARKSSSQASFA